MSWSRPSNREFLQDLVFWVWDHSPEKVVVYMVGSIGRLPGLPVTAYFVYLSRIDAVFQLPSVGLQVNQKEKERIWTSSPQLGNEYFHSLHRPLFIQMWNTHSWEPQWNGLLDYSLMCVLSLFFIKSMSLITQKILKCCEQYSVVVLSEQGVESMSWIWDIPYTSRVPTTLRTNVVFFNINVIQSYFVFKKTMI